MDRLGTGEREILRRVHGPVVEQGMWRERTDQELRELYKEAGVIETAMDWVCRKNRSVKDR